MEYEFLIDGELKSLALEQKGSGYIIRDGRLDLEADIHAISPNTLSMIINGQSQTIHFARDKEILYLFYNGSHFAVQEPSSEGAVVSATGSKSREDMLKISTPMPGKVIKVCVEEGEEVREKQTLVIVEAMKMENEIKAELNCRVKKIFCLSGDLVDVTTNLMELVETEDVQGE
jgi:biotin carboxyl carrier protein